LGAKVVCNQNVLLHEFGIAQEQPWATDAVVVIVLAVNLLVVVAPAQAVDGESGAAVGVGESVVACGNHAGNKQRQVVQTLVLLNSGKGLQRGAGEGVGGLGSVSGNQRRRASDFYDLLFAADTQFHQP